FKKNPEAFTDNNKNNLKAGLVLQLPTEAEARAITSKESAAEVRRQTAAWKNRGKPSAPAPIDGIKPSLKSEAADSMDVETAPEGQLKVITPTDDSK
ncbi:FimV/HubP family polar landmark protein, partial [Neptunomonas phycophila]|uniref:FimV/HubP family polar landmark protein n=1 Tax=Neptunomonas phycophila TaxID=1572645 RepID=UPI0026E24B0B